MNREERVLKVINREPVDYLPSFIKFADRTRDKEISKALGLSSPGELDDYLNNHIILAYTQHDGPVYFRNDKATVDRLEEEGFIGVDRENNVFYDCWGAGMLMNHDTQFFSYGVMEGNKEKNEAARKYLPEDFMKKNEKILDMELEDAIKHYQLPDADKAGNYKMIEDHIEQYAGDLLVVAGGYMGVYERGYILIGFEQFMTEIALRPNMVEDLLDKITEYKIQDAKNKIALGLKIGHTGDDLGTQKAGLFSRKMFQEMIKPRLARIFAVYKDAHIPVTLHSCGSIMEYLPDLIEIGLDVWEPVQPCNDLEFIKREYGKDLIFWGGIDTQKLPFLKPDEVKELTINTIRTLGKNGGYIVGPSQALTNDVPIENIKALLETIIAERSNL